MEIVLAALVAAAVAVAVVLLVQRPRQVAAPAGGLAESAEPVPERSRAVELRRIAVDLFDFDEMARRTLSQHWARAQSSRW